MLLGNCVHYCLAHAFKRKKGLACAEEREDLRTHTHTQLLSKCMHGCLAQKTRRHIPEHRWLQVCITIVCCNNVKTFPNFSNWNPQALQQMHPIISTMACHEAHQLWANFGWPYATMAWLNSSYAMSACPPWEHTPWGHSPWVLVDHVQHEGHHEGLLMTNPSGNFGAGLFLKTSSGQVG